MKRTTFSIVNHRLVGNKVVHLVCAKNTCKLVEPDMIVLHYTAGVNMMSSALYLTRPDVAASAHVVIGRDGKAVQLVPFNIEAWHAGRSFYVGRAELNHSSIGIELDNLGKLRLEGSVFLAECGREVPSEEVFADCSSGELTYWHRYTEVQVRALTWVCQLLQENYPIRYIVGHSDITSRKSDPGPGLEEAGFINFKF